MAKREMTRPHHLIKLHAEYGTQKCSEILGCSRNYVTDMIRKPEVATAYEKSAQHYLELQEARRKASGQATHVILMVRVPKDQVDNATAVLGALGGQVRQFTDQ